MNPQEKSTKITFDPTFNFGHILSLAASLVMVAASWSNLDKRVLVVEESRKYQELRDDTQDRAVSARQHELTEAIAEIKQGISRLNEKLDRKQSNGNL